VTRIARHPLTYGYHEARYTGIFQAEMTMSDETPNSRRSVLKELTTGLRDTPMGRPGEPAELAPLYVLLAENKATYVTGQILGATGGLGGA
jgi:NAD(P)-dependent dehydrogenase (short-subunit alcohol dehydrogenase family)